MKQKKKVIKFWAGWCGPCKTYEPIFNTVKSKFGNTNVEFIEINVDSDVELMDEYRDYIKSIPFTIIEVDGVIEHKMVGILREKQLEDLING